jgi:hypothetical protein
VPVNLPLTQQSPKNTHSKPKNQHPINSENKHKNNLSSFCIRKHPQNQLQPAKVYSQDPGATSSLSTENRKRKLAGKTKSALFSPNRQSSPNYPKEPKILEDTSKKSGFASHGDFRRYLYEAPILSIPVSLGDNE